MDLKLKIISSNTPEGSAIDGEFSTATFELLGCENDISKEKLQQLIYEKLDTDYQLTAFGRFKSSGLIGGRLTIIDWEAPNVGDLIDL